MPLFHGTRATHGERSGPQSFQRISLGLIAKMLVHATRERVNVRIELRISDQWMGETSLDKGHESNARALAQQNRYKKVCYVKRQ